MATEKPMTHVVSIEVDKSWRDVRKRKRNVRLTPKMVITELGERLPRDGSWKYGTAFTGSRRILPETLRPLTVEEQRAPLREAMDRATGELNSAYKRLKDAQEEVDQAIKELAEAEKALIKFDKQHGDKEKES